jgi:hypothetical protein
VATTFCILMSRSLCVTLDSRAIQLTPVNLTPRAFPFRVLDCATAPQELDFTTRGADVPCPTVPAILYGMLGVDTATLAWI